MEELFHAALAHPPEARAAFLDSACGGDDTIRREVELLVSKEGQAGSFLERPVVWGSTSVPPQEWGPYRITGLLGAGGMGEVYRAHDVRLGRDVALKILPEEFARDPNRLARFRREARALASLNHPNIAAIYALERHGDVDCLVLELVDGETLRGPLPVAKALHYAHQIATAIEAAHAKGIIHRDLKPSNAKVTLDGVVKVLDFGLAKELFATDPDPDRLPDRPAPDFETHGSHIAGTPGYMSPEQSRGEPIDQRTDVWSFGCLLYELLTGERAFPESAMFHEPNWQTLPRVTPARIRELLRQCLRQDKTQRLAEVGTIRKELERVRNARSRKLPLIAVGALGFAVIVAAIWLPNSAPPGDRSSWIQLTSLSDPVSQPVLSHDGTKLAFVRSANTYLALGQVYSKKLPDGDPIQLTHDKLKKLNPAFSPDDGFVSYTAVDPQFNWSTWLVPVSGGEPKQWLRDIADLVWTGPHHILFSKMRLNPHMDIVASTDQGNDERTIYAPAGNRARANRPQVSADGKWVAMAEMLDGGNWGPCRVVPSD
ncbi:MAG: protein kinase, partial [Acidobacteriaceae bacterium]|nr:protein kinase [Acidobacteriaceae bacterium]